MIFIKHIEYFRTDRDPLEIMRITLPYGGSGVILTDQEGEKKFLPAKVVRELVQGRRFCRRGHEDVIIGMADQAAELLGLQFSAWEHMEDAVEASHASIRKIRDASLWTRIKWVFTGVNV